MCHSSSQAAIVLLNGVEVDRKMASAGCMKRDGLVVVQLSEGWNELALKMSCHFGQVFEFWAGLYELGELFARPAQNLIYHDWFD